MSRIVSGSHCYLDRRAWERCAMHFVGALQQLYNYIISHLNKLPCFCCHCVYIHSDFYPGEEMQFKQCGTQKKTKTMMKRITRRGKKSKTFLERIRLDWESVELLTECSKHTLFCYTASDECQRDVFALKHPPQVNNTSGAEWRRRQRRTPWSNTARLFPVSTPITNSHPASEAADKAWRLRQTTTTAAIDRFDCDAHSFIHSGCGCGAVIPDKVQPRSRLIST